MGQSCEIARKGPRSISWTTENPVPPNRTNGAPKFDPHKTPSKDKAKTDEKAALLDRMKAAADKKTSE